VHTPEPLRQEARRMAERVGNRLRDKGLAGRTVTVKVRYHDFRTITRSTTVGEPLSAPSDISRLALGLLEQVELGGGVRLLGVSVRNLTAAPAHQETLALGDEEAPLHRGDIRRAVEAVRARFGDDAVGPAGLLEPERD
jgi:DNA polymerase-4